MAQPLLQAAQLSCVRDERVLFKGLNLTLKAGQMLQVSGLNGSGKSSLLRILAGLMAPTTGSIHQEIAAENKSCCLWIGHAPGIKAHLSARENLAWLSTLHQTLISDEQALELALATVGLSDYAEAPCYVLSAGQQRRVALARLYLSPPLLWFLDEPFAALDQQTVAQLEQHLSAHCARGGAVVLTTHQPLVCRPEFFTELHLNQVHSS